MDKDFGKKLSEASKKLNSAMNKNKCPFKCEKKATVSYPKHTEFKYLNPNWWCIAFKIDCVGENKCPIIKR